MCWKPKCQEKKLKANAQKQNKPVQVGSEVVLNGSKFVIKQTAAANVKK